MKWIIDAGANIGDETVKFRHFHPQASVIALEIEDGNLEVLRANCGNDAEVHIEAKALWSTAGQNLRLVRGHDPETHKVAADRGSIPTTSFSELQAKYSISRFDIVKLDIEGAESELLKPGHTDWLQSTDAVIMEVADHESPGCVQALLREMQGPVDCSIVGENIIAIRRESGLRAESRRYL